MSSLSPISSRHCIVGANGKAWLGGTNETTGTYLWYSSNKTVRADIWAADQPDNIKNKENCMEASVFLRGANDVSCVESRHFICKAIRTMENPKTFPSLVDGTKPKCLCILGDFGTESPLNGFCNCHCYSAS